MTQSETNKEKNIKSKKLADFTGKYLKAIGRRKTSVAQVRLYEEGEGNIVVNDQDVSEYFSVSHEATVSQILKLTNHSHDLDFSILVKGGGKSGQAEAIRHGLARILVLFDKELKLTIKAKGWLTRDSRKVERKKPGLKKARRAPQWSKR